MKRALPNCPLGPAGILWPGLLACLLVLSTLLAARGDQHWTTNGIHKGFVERSVQSGSTSGLDSSGSSEKFAPASFGPQSAWPPNR